VSVQGHQNYMSNIFLNGERYDGGVNRSQIGNNPWAINWQHDL